jgi:sulfur relay (sulfurtransferase) complex TusBCD TusD component (DsrE family)
MLADVQSMANVAGFVTGVHEGLKLSKDGKKASDARGYREDAAAKLKELADAFDVASFPELEEMSGMTSDELGEIKRFLGAPPA